MEHRASGLDESFAGHWTGDAPLWSAYWLVGVLGTLVVYCVGAFGLLLSSFLFPAALEHITLVVFAGLLAYASFACISIWRCSRNSRWAGWGYLARIHVVASVLLVSIIFAGVLSGEIVV